MFALGLIPAGLLIYGLVSKRKGFIWVGGVWLGLNLLVLMLKPKVGNPTSIDAMPANTRA